MGVSCARQQAYAVIATTAIMVAVIRRPCLPWPCPDGLPCRGCWSIPTETTVYGFFRIIDCVFTRAIRVMSHSHLLHYVSLDGAGGVELQFVEFLQAAQRLAALDQSVVACGRGIHPLVRSRLDAADVPLSFEKYAGRLKLPKWPSAIRARRQQTIIRRYKPSAVLIWNRLRDSLNTLAAAGPERCVYWERGASWFADESSAKRRFLAEIQMVLCNSVAARRMLELRWGYRGQAEVVPNALRPSLAALEAEPRRLPEDAPVKLGVVARLQPIKGVALALHSVAELRRRGRDVRLDVAGDGPERERLEALSQRLGLSRIVRFCGLVSDMRTFYADLDLLIHPALREPFGQIVLEAGAYGVPSLVSAVDGLVEVVADDESGLCLAPSLPLADYAGLGGSNTDLPPFVYDPALDEIGPPRLLNPRDMADGIETLLDAPDRYARMSASAIDRVRREFRFEDHVQHALTAIGGFSGHRMGVPASHRNSPVELG